MSLNLWVKKGSAITSGLDPQLPNVLYETGSIIIGGGSPVFKMWYTLSTFGVYYAESATGLPGSWQLYGSNPIIPNTNGQAYQRIFKNSGTYYLYTSSFGGGPPNSNVHVWTSTDGVTFSLQNASALVLGTQAWENTFIGQLTIAGIDGSGTWWGYYQSKEVSGFYGLGIATSIDGINWTKAANNPQTIPNGNLFSSFQLINGVYYAWGQGACPNIPAYPAGLQLPSDIFRAYSLSLSGPWTACTPNGIPNFYRTLAAEGVGADVGQAADPTVLSDGTNLWMFYDATATGTGNTGFTVRVAQIANATLASLVSTNEGVFDVPLSSTQGLALELVTLASDTFTSGDPNWTTLTAASGWNAPTFGTGSAAGTTAVTRGSAYYSGISWASNPDQWMSFTLKANADSGSFTSGFLRGSTSGAATCYLIQWGGAATGSPGGWAIQKFVAGTFTALLSGTTTGNVGDVFTGSVIGTTLSMYQNGNLLGVITDASIATGAPGISLYGHTVGSDSSVSAFSAGNFQSPLITFSISGSVGTPNATVSYSGTASGSVTADGSGNYTISGLAPGTYTITPSKTGFIFSPSAASEGSGGGNITGANFTASGSNYYSQPDCRVAPFGPNSSRTVQGTKIYDVQTSSNPAVPGVNSRVSKPVDSRIAAIIPENSRTPGIFGPGQN